MLQLSYIKKIFSKSKKYAVSHKVISGIVLVVVAFGAYKIYTSVTNTSGQTTYTLGTVTRGTIISIVSASGQVSTSDQIDIKAKVSGDITWIGVNPGDKVYAGQALMSIDSTTAKQAVLDAEASLTASRLQFQKRPNPSAD